MIKTLFVSFLFFAATMTAIFAQDSDESHASIKAEQSLFFEQTENLDSINMEFFGIPKEKLSKKIRSKECTLKKDVYGYHPYWMDKYYNTYDYGLLSTFIYFCYDLNPKTGGYKSIHRWKTSPSIAAAKKAGNRVELCLKSFSRHKTFLTNRKAWEKLANNLIELLDARNADGINIDFEAVPKSQARNLVEFCKYLSLKLKNAGLRDKVTEEIKEISISMAIPAVDWNGAFLLSRLDPYIDAFLIMGYDYHYKSAKLAGPVAPLDHDSRWYSTSISRSINNYLKKGITSSKLILALPYYGYEWKTHSAQVPSKRQTNTKGKARVYSQIKKLLKRKNTEPEWHYESKTPYITFKSGKTVRQLWYENEVSLEKKYDIVNGRNLGGVGIWALGYDNGHPELWNLLEDKFLRCQNNNETSIPKTHHEDCKPTTNILKINEAYPTDFTIRFEDKDECEEGWSGMYYQVLEKNKEEWVGNFYNGFFNDKFEGAKLSPHWTPFEGLWSAHANRLYQGRQDQSNTNLYTSLMQRDYHSYLYHWWGKIGGDGNNRRAGLHFFADDPSAVNRGNSYFVYYRVDSKQVEIYKVKNNRFSRKAVQPCEMDGNTDYDFKITYNPKSGLIEAYLDNRLLIQWNDSEPYTYGEYISFRTGDCFFSCDFLKVYKSRESSETISVGATQQDDLQKKDKTGETSFCRIVSIAKNKYNQWSAPDVKETRIE
ncbi:MAG: glycosyl hydrolase family 18 protein [Chitinophagales bacterium]